jgi:hypothetical protein
MWKKKKNPELITKMEELLKHGSLEQVAEISRYSATAEQQPIVALAPNAARPFNIGPIIYANRKSTGFYPVVIYVIGDVTYRGIDGGKEHGTTFCLMNDVGSKN